MRSLFRLALSKQCVRAVLRVRTDCHSLPKDVRCRKKIPGEVRFCNLCQCEQPGDEYQLVFQRVSGKYPDLALTKVNSCGRQTYMGLPNLSHLGVNADAGPIEGKTSDQP